jgi:hypothetical protein
LARADFLWVRAVSALLAFQPQRLKSSRDGAPAIADRVLRAGPGDPQLGMCEDAASRLMRLGMAMWFGALPGEEELQAAVRRSRSALVNPPRP